jgi:hypothetical protein
MALKEIQAGGLRQLAYHGTALPVAIGLDDDYGVFAKWL